MYMAKLGSFCGFIPAAVLLAVSFFVLVAQRKLDSKPLKAFGYVVAGLLWLGALGAFMLCACAGPCPIMRGMMKGGMMGKMGMAGKMKCAGMMQAPEKAAPAGSEARVPH
jgi:hypothetical protein